MRQLHAPFLKVEDLSRSYRPLICEMKEWPHPDPCCSPKACPFDSPRRGECSSIINSYPFCASMVHSRYYSVAVEEFVLFPLPPAKALQHATWHPRASPHHPHPTPQPHPPPVHPEEKRPGYCECCTQKYEDLHKVTLYTCTAAKWTVTLDLLVRNLPLTCIYILSFFFLAFEEC